MILNILTIIKTMLYIFLTGIEVNRFLVLLITSLTSISILELIKKTRWKIRDGLRLLFYSVVSVILFADTVYYIQFNTLPSVALLKQLGLLSAVGDSVKDLLSTGNLLLIVDLPILLVGFLIRGRKKRKKEEIFFEDKRPNYFFFSAGLLVVSLIFTLVTGRFDSIKNQEVYSYHILDLKNNLFQSDQVTYAGDIDQADLEEIIERTRLEEGELTGLGRGKNLLVVQVEALQNFALGMEYEGQELTPELNKLVEDKSTVYYDNYYQLVGRGNTSDAEFVSNNSLHPSMEEPSYTRFAGRTFYSLPQLLKDQGYMTVAMHGHDGDYWNRREAYKTLGFDEFLDVDFYQDYEKIGLGVGDRDFYQQSLDYLRQYKDGTEEPFYAFLVSLTSHTPFNMPEKYMELDILPGHEDTMLGRYINSIHYADRQLGFLLDYLKELGLYDDTVLAIYGDHFAISSAKEEEAEVMTQYFGERYDFDSMMNIPLLIHLPNEEVNQTISQVGSQLDFYPTILNIMGYENEKGLMFGRDLTNFQGYNFVTPQTYMAKGSFIDQDSVFVISRDGIFEHSRAYDIESRKEIDIEGFRESYQKAIDEINLSDYILNNGILEEYILTGGRIDLARGGDKSQPGEIYTYQGGGLDGIRSRKGGLVQLELEIENGELLIASHKEEDLGQLVEEAGRKNIRLVFTTRKDEVQTLKKAYEEYGGPGVVAGIENYESYLDLTNGMYGEVLLDPGRKNYSIEEVRSFTSRYPNLGIVLDGSLNVEDLDGRIKKYIYID